MNFKPQFLLFTLIFSVCFFGCENKDFSVNIRGGLAYPPIAPGQVHSSSTTTHPYITPWVKWTEGLDLSKTGLNSYEISVGSTSCGSDILPWTNTELYVGSAAASLFYRYGSFYIGGSGASFTEGVDYYFNVRSKDNFNQLGEPNCKKFNYTTSGWKQQSYFKAANSDADDRFGQGVAIDGDTMVVGAPQEYSSSRVITSGTTASSDNSSPNTGAVYVYRRSGDTWVQEAYIKAPNADANDQFGYQVAIYGDTIAVGAPFESSSFASITNGTTASSDNSILFSGAVYIFQRSGSIWTQQAYIKASNRQMNDRFGTSLSLNNNTLAVGSVGEDTTATDSGAVYVYTRSGVSWSQQTILKAANASNGTYFGATVTVENDTLAVGSIDESSSQSTITNGTGAATDKGAPQSGAVYVYKRSGVSWAQEAYIKASNPNTHAQLGSSLSISGDTLAVGSARESSNAKTITNGTTSSSDTSAAEAGAVYVYKRTGSNWAQEAYIKPPNTTTSMHFGYTVSIKGDKIAVGAPDEDSGANAIVNDSVVSDDTLSEQSGAVYLFERSSSTWSLKTYIKPINSNPALNFGAKVSLSASSTLTVGAPLESTVGTEIINGQSVNHYGGTTANYSGAVYVYVP